MELQNKEKTYLQRLKNFLWDTFCLFSIVGIWPRFVEPNKLSIKHLKIPVRRLPKELENLRIVYFSDLHLQPEMTDYFLDKLKRHIKELKADIILFAGDFLCYSNLLQEERLVSFLNELHAPGGCYAVLGNHDYEKPVMVNENGEYDISIPEKSLVKKGIKLLFKNTRLAGATTERVKKLQPHPGLVEALKKTPFELLHNTNKVIKINNRSLNICGLGEYTMGKAIPEQAYKKYDITAPGIILVHNPDSFPLLNYYPGNLILCGHTHGGQINLPYIWKKFTLMENPEYKQGLFKVNGKHLYVSRGTGSALAFRINSIPELVCIELTAAT